jgi:hypothetical protein
MINGKPLEKAKEKVGCMFAKSRDDLGAYDGTVPRGHAWDRLINMADWLGHAKAEREIVGKKGKQDRLSTSTWLMVVQVLR